MKLNILQLLRKIALKRFKSYIWSWEEERGNKSFSLILLYIQTQIVPCWEFHLRKDENNELSGKGT